MEDYYFPEQKTSRQNALEGNYSGKHEYIGDLPYSLSRSKSEVESAILKDIKEHTKFILSGVAMNWDEKVLSKIKNINKFLRYLEENIDMKNGIAIVGLNGSGIANIE